MYQGDSVTLKSNNKDKESRRHGSKNISIWGACDVHKVCAICTHCRRYSMPYHCLSDVLTSDNDDTHTVITQGHMRLLKLFIGDDGAGVGTVIDIE